MARKTPELPALLNRLQLIQELAGPEVFRDALAIAREEMHLTPAAVALMIRRIANPDWVPNEVQEAGLRKMSPTTLRGMKQRRELPLVIQGVVNSED